MTQETVGDVQGASEASTAHDLMTADRKVESSRSRLLNNFSALASQELTMTKGPSGLGWIVGRGGHGFFNLGTLSRKHQKGDPDEPG